VTGQVDQTCAVQGAGLADRESWLGVFDSGDLMRILRPVSTPDGGASGAA